MARFLNWVRLVIFTFLWTAINQRGPGPQFLNTEGNEGHEGKTKARVLECAGMTALWNDATCRVGGKRFNFSLKPALTPALSPRRGRNGFRCSREPRVRRFPPIKLAPGTPEPPSTRDWIRTTHNHVKRRMKSLSLLLGEKARMRAVVTTNCK